MDKGQFQIKRLFYIGSGSVLNIFGIIGPPDKSFSVLYNFFPVFLFR